MEIGMSTSPSHATYEIKWLGDLEVWNELHTKRAKPSHEFLFDLRLTREFVIGLIDRSIDIFTYASRDFIKGSEPLSYKRVLDNVGLLNVESYDNWWKNQINKKARNSFRKAEKSGVYVKFFDCANMIPEEVFLGIWRIYNETPIRQERAFQHFGRSLESVKDLIRAISHKFGLFCAFIDRELIGFSLVIFGDQVAQISQILSAMSQFENCPNNALVVSIVRTCTDRGYFYITYGRMGLAHPSLTKFKESNGFRQFNVNRYFIPLTYRGAVAIRLGVHQQLKDLAPEKLKYYLLPIYTFVSRSFRVEL
jgi:hypothetical protein